MKKWVQKKMEVNSFQQNAVEMFCSLALSYQILSSIWAKKMAVFQTPTKLYQNVIKGFKKQNQISRLKISVILLVQADRLYEARIRIYYCAN